MARQHKRHLRTPYNLRDYISRLLRCGLFDHLNWNPSLKRFSHEHSFTLYTYTYIGTLINYTNLHYYIIKLVITFLKCLWFVKWIIVRHDMTKTLCLLTNFFILFVVGIFVINKIFYGNAANKGFANFCYIEVKRFYS